MKDELLRWLNVYAAIAFTVFTILLVIRTHRRVGRPSWPLHSRWLVVMLVGSWGGRIVDLALARNFGTDLNPPRTVVWWFVMDVSLTWVFFRMVTGRLILMDQPRPPGRYTHRGREGTPE